jgi:hypothetical protein
MPDNIAVVEFKHSVVAGRRTISFNNNVVHDSTNALNNTFEHGWAHKTHLLRIVAKVRACHTRLPAVAAQELYLHFFFLCPCILA